MNKKLIVMTLVVVILIALFFPKPIVVGGGMIANQEFDKCVGLYIETHNDAAFDGNIGGLCFGYIKRAE